MHGAADDCEPMHVHAEPRRQRGGRAFGFEPEQALSRGEVRVHRYEPEREEQGQETSFAEQGEGRPHRRVEC
eukprot:5584131-Pleurochrysis_carterae.AAC.1